MFKFLIEGKTIAELKENITEFFNEFEELQPDQNIKIEQQDFLTEAAAHPTNVPPSENVGTLSALDVDSKGMPWDGRIHASSRAITKEGAWRYRRGVEDSTIAAIEQQLIGKAKAMQMEALPTTSGSDHQFPPAAAPVVAPFVAPVIPMTAPPPVPVIPTAPPPMPAPELTLPNAHTLETFKKNLVPVLAKMIKDGKLTQDYINALKQHFGVTEIYQVNDQQIEEMFRNFVQYKMIASAE